MNSKHKPHRMCIVCKGRYLQSSLVRLQPLDKMLHRFSGIGRSFYLCQECLSLDKTDKIISSKYRLDKNIVRNQIKEILFEYKNKSK
jgi:predicted RNA-binding protein YlxR (DUF448 family)